jgi:hypothetical protein
VSLIRNSKSAQRGNQKGAQRGTFGGAEREHTKITQRISRQHK